MNPILVKDYFRKSATASDLILLLLAKLKVPPIELAEMHGYELLPRSGRGQPPAAGGCSTRGAGAEHPDRRRGLDGGAPAAPRLVVWLGAVGLPVGKVSA
jgi:hypothetical protein